MIFCLTAYEIHDIRDNPEQTQTSELIPQLS